MKRFNEAEKHSWHSKLFENMQIFFFLWKNRPPTSYFDLPAQLERSGTPMLKRTQKFWEQAVLDKMRSNLKKERCLRCWKLKDHLLFSKLKKLSNDLHPLSSNKKSRGEEIGERGTLVEFWTSYNYYCCSPKMKEKNEIVVLGVSQSELSNL